MKIRVLATAIAVTLGAICAAPAAAQTEIQILPRSATLTVGGRIQTQLQASSVDGAPADVFFRRARLRLDIEVSDFLDVRFNPDFSGGNATLQDAYARLNFADELRVTFGQFKRAFSIFELSSSTDLPIIERDGRIAGLSDCAGVGGVCSFSRLTEKLSFDGRDQGIRLDGRIGGLQYALTGTNGEGINVGDVNDDKSFSARVSHSIGPARVGLFGGIHDYPVTLDGGEEQDTDFAQAIGADVEIGSWRSGAHVMAAAVTGDNWRSGRAGSQFKSFQLLGSYYFAVDGQTRVEGLEPLLRLAWADPDDGVEDDGGLLFTPGLMLYFAGKNGVSVNLDTYAPQGDRPTEYSIKLQTFLYF
jgi:hypothetical protein